MIRIAVCDDDEYMLGKLKCMIDREFAGHTSDYIIKCYSSAGLLLDDNSSTAFDIIFLDIDMPETDGFETAEKLRNDFMQCYIIFVTSHSNLVYRSFDFQPFHFIPKNPADDLENMISSVVTRLMEHMKQHRKIILENYDETAAIYYHNIIYIESARHYLKYFIQNRDDPVSVRGSVNDAESDFSSYDFIRIHRRYIVNLKYMKSIDKKIGKVYMNFNGKKISLPMSTSYKESADQKFTVYLRKTL